MSVSGAATIPVPGGRIRITGATGKGLGYEATVNGSESSGTLTGCGAVVELGGGGTSLTGCRDDRRVSPLAPAPGSVAIQGANRVGSAVILRIAGG